MNFLKVTQYLHWKHWIILLFLISAGIGIRCLSWYMEPKLVRDGISYLNWSFSNTTAEIQDPFFLESNAPPLLVATLRLLPKDKQQREFIARTIILLLSTLVIPSVFLLFYELSARNHLFAYGGAFLTVIHPSLIEYSHQILRETPYLVSSAAMILCIVCAWKYQKKLFWGIGGTLGAFALMFRWESLELLPIWIFFLVSGYVFFPKKRVEIITGTFIFWIFFLIALSILILCFSSFSEIFKIFQNRFFIQQGYHGIF